MEKLSNWLKDKKDTPLDREKQSVVFIGHGSPMNAILDNDFTKSLEAFARTLPNPRAILVISAHWLTKGTFVLGSEKPRTIYDFYGFPEELYRLNYPAPGAPEVAREVQETVRKTPVQWDESWGLDHGTWTILQRMFPQADIPVFQLSIDYTKPPEFHYELANELATLRRKGVLIIGSGNIVHNLRRVDWRDMNAPPYDWAAEFDANVWEKLQEGDHQALIRYESLGAAAGLAVPTNDHYLPMIYIAALQEKNEEVLPIYEGFHHASVSMRCFRIAG